MPSERGENAITRWAQFSAEKLASMGGVELAELARQLGYREPWWLDTENPSFFAIEQERSA